MLLSFSCRWLPFDNFPKIPVSVEQNPVKFGALADLTESDHALPKLSLRSMTFESRDCVGMDVAPRLRQLAGPSHDDYVCAGCSRSLCSQMQCSKHGEQGMLFKCFCCCKPGLFFCGGTTHFYTECHIKPLNGP
jgi:hypothetical protein